MSNATSASLNIWEAAKYPLWEIGLLCSNGAIYIFNLIFLCTIFWLFVVVVVVVVLEFFLKKNVFFILFFHVFFIFLFSTFLFLFIFYLFINFFDGSNGPPYSSKQYDIFHVQIIWNSSCKSTNEMLWKWKGVLPYLLTKLFSLIYTVFVLFMHPITIFFFWIRIFLTYFLPVLIFSFWFRIFLIFAFFIFSFGFRIFLVFLFSIFLSWCSIFLIFLFLYNTFLV